ncbi:hypothetical protein T4D_11362 [Trichinella pseudospiralis]|uniref:Uncharacterized protein n=1 Tax=Trichinella pseudospiralis TaxID=6337 RepID=A0A0V1DSA3_TRIPS|nr:hypothetical protein T4D_11362 [Trichinella pseudospiralis]
MEYWSSIKNMEYYMIFRQMDETGKDHSEENCIGEGTGTGTFWGIRYGGKGQGI